MDLEKCKYTEDHTWVCPEHENKARIGITAHAQYHLGDILFVDLPQPKDKIKQGKKMGEIEAMKGVADLISPASGQVLEINEAVFDEPRLVNREPMAGGWLVVVELSNPAELAGLMNNEAYDSFAAESFKQEE